MESGSSATGGAYVPGASACEAVERGFAGSAYIDSGQSISLEAGSGLILNAGFDSGSNSSVAGCTSGGIVLALEIAWSTGVARVGSADGACR